MHIRHEHIRHEHMRYDELLMKEGVLGYARALVRGEIEAVLGRWGWKEGRLPAL